jgi:t-SNARE complex subunit (syntaxin)
MKKVFKILSIVSYEELDQKLAQMRAIEKSYRDEVRERMTKELSALNPMTDGAKIKELMENMNGHISLSHSIEAGILDFVNSIK